MTDSISYRLGQETLSARLIASPKQLAAPAIILLPAIAGCNPYIDSMAARLAANGYRVAIHDYYQREGANPDVSTPQKIGAAVAALPDRRTLDEIAALTAALKIDPRVKNKKVATFGLCIGGMYAYLAATEIEELCCAVDYYGLIRYVTASENKPVSPIDRAANLKAPLLCHFGDYDRLISSQDRIDFAAALQAAAVPYEMFIYHGAPHAFDEDFRLQVFRPAAAADAWRRSLDFLAWHMSSERRS